jgi:hypothetical protein
MRNSGADDLSFDFEAGLENAKRITAADMVIPDLPAEAIGQQPGNFRKNFRKVWA